MPKKLSCVLLIDDDEPTNYLNKMVLEEANCANQVQVLQSGRGALYYLSNTGKISQQSLSFPQPDLIFLDINMPAMDGWEFLEKYKALRRQQKGKVIIVMLTTSQNPDDELKAKNYPDVDGFIHKPLTKEAIEKIVKKYF